MHPHCRRDLQIPKAPSKSQVLLDTRLEELQSLDVYNSEPDQTSDPSSELTVNPGIADIG